MAVLKAEVCGFQTSEGRTSHWRHCLENQSLAHQHGSLCSAVCQTLDHKPYSSISQTRITRVDPQPGHWPHLLHLQACPPLKHVVTKDPSSCTRAAHCTESTENSLCRTECITTQGTKLLETVV